MVLITVLVVTWLQTGKYAAIKNYLDLAAYLLSLLSYTGVIVVTGNHSRLVILALLPVQIIGMP